MTRALSIYLAIRQSRNDLTDWAIHWVRPSEAESAFQVLLRIVKQGILRPGLAPRGNPPRPTIYGPLRAVCFTEQPLLEFAKYVQIRASDAEVTGYAVAVHREDLFAEGGMPVISGLSSSTIEVDATHPDHKPGFRILDPICLPLDEQYRFVAFSPTRHSRSVGAAIPSIGRMNGSGAGRSKATSPRRIPNSALRDTRSQDQAAPRAVVSRKAGSTSLCRRMTMSVLSARRKSQLRAATTTRRCLDTRIGAI